MRYLRVKDIQKIFSCSKNKAYDIVNHKCFPKTRIGRSIYIEEDAFKEWQQHYLYKNIN